MEASSQPQQSSPVPTTPLQQKLTPPSPPPAQTFTTFPLLPPELRIHIFRLSLQNPRLITISRHFPRNSKHQQLIRRHVSSPLLSLNHLSRREALLHYSTFANANTGINISPADVGIKFETKGYYVNPGNDVVYIQGTHYEDRWFRGVVRGVMGGRHRYRADGGNEGGMGSELAKVRRLAVDEAFLKDEIAFGREVASPILVFLVREGREVEEVVVVGEEGERGGSVEGWKRKMMEVRDWVRGKYVMWGGWEETVRELDEWVCPDVKVMTVGELKRYCGE